MARWGTCDFKQLKNFQKKLDKLQKADREAFCQECAKELAARLLAKAKKRTPTGDYSNLIIETGKTGGTLKRSWFATPITKEGDTWKIEIFNDKLYASYVEFGHRQTPGRFVPALGKKLKKGWVNGSFMLTISETELDSQAPKIIENKLMKYLGECFDD